MKNIIGSITAVFILAFALNGFSDSGNANPLKVKNFGRINANYYRGAQPKANDFADLKKLGIRTIIDLRKKRANPTKEKTWARRAGMNYFNIPLSSKRPATGEQTEAFLKLVNDPALQPVFVHCRAGKHRTGGMTAVYRITRDSWTADKAFAEMKEYGFDSPSKNDSWKEFVYAYYSEWIKTADSTTVNRNAPSLSGSSADEDFLLLQPDESVASCSQEKDVCLPLLPSDKDSVSH